MSGDTVRVVVGEGRTEGRGVLRFVLQGEGYDVVGEATTSAELARLLALHRPDAVVIDDGIGVTAVQMSREVAPDTKVVLVWPDAVVPIGGDARVDPDRLLGGLSDAVAKVVGRAPVAPTIVAPDWVERVRKDPKELRAKLALHGGVPDRRPSVTELQRRGRRLHPHAGGSRIEGPEIVEDDERVAAVVLPMAAAEAASADGQRARAGRPIRDGAVGRLALGGAAAATVVVLAMAVGASRIEPVVIAADPLFPRPADEPPDQPPVFPSGQAAPLDLRTSAIGVTAPTGILGPHAGGFLGPDDEPPTNQPPDGGPPTNQPPDNEPPDNEPPDNEPPTNEPPLDSSLPGRSEYNPLGGPPGWTGDHPASDPDLPGTGPSTQNGDVPGSSERNPKDGPPGQTDQAKGHSKAGSKHEHKT